MFSCKSKKDNNNGIQYSEYINSKKLVKSVIEIYPSGQEKAIIFNIEGNPDGFPVKEVHFFENGKIQVEGTLKNKLRHGIWTFYHPNGLVWSTGEFNMGKSVGIFKIYDEKGQIKVKSYYDNNKKVKEEYFLKGKLYKSVDLTKK